MNHSFGVGRFSGWEYEGPGIGGDDSLEVRAMIVEGSNPQEGGRRVVSLHSVIAFEPVCET